MSVTDSTVIAVASGKGGVGKTTTSINLGAASATATDRSVVVVDVDLAMANLVDFLSLDFDPEADTSLHEVLAEEASVTDVIYRAPGGIDVVPSGTRLKGFAATNPRKLGEAVATLREEYDLVILDTGAGVSYETLLPLGLADAVVLVTTPRVASVRDTEKTKNIASRVGGVVAGLVVVRTGTGNAPPPERMAEFISVPLLGHVPEDDAVPRAQDAGKPVTAHNIISEAAKAYWDIAEGLDAALRECRRSEAAKQAADAPLSGLGRLPGSG